MQDHWNTFNEPGEYNLEKCIFFTGSKKKISKLFRPIIKYSSNDYIYNTVIVEFHDEINSNLVNRAVKALQEINLDF